MRPFLFGRFSREISSPHWRSTRRTPRSSHMSDEKYPVEKSEQEWREVLSADQFRVLREHGTERAGTSPLNFEKRTGVFHCAACGQPLFESNTKYESGSGWPSFWKPLP